MPRIKKTLTKSERKMVDDLFKAACKGHNNPTTTANNGAYDDSKCKREDSSAADDALSANQHDEKVSANATEKEDPTSSDEEDALLGQLICNSSRTAQHRKEQRQATVEEEEAAQLLVSLHTYAVAPPVTQKQSNYNGHKLRRKSSVSEGSNKEMESTPKKKRRENKSFEQRIEDLRAYKEKHGHVNVKKNDDKSLYEFCVKIKCARSNPEAGRRNLTTKDIASLDALGFDWSVRPREPGSKTFEQRMDDLQASGTEWDDKWLQHFRDLQVSVL